MFIVFEGIDGSGKTTLAKLLVQKLKDAGFAVTHTREPGGTPIGEQIRDLILNNEQEVLTDLLLVNAGRLEHVKTVIKPKIDNGEFVVCERFLDSSYVYQVCELEDGKERAFGEKLFNEIEEGIHDIIGGYITINPVVSLETSLSRIKQVVGTDKFESNSTLLTKTAARYSARFAARATSTIPLDAEQPLEILSQYLDRVVNDIVKAKRFTDNAWTEGEPLDE